MTISRKDFISSTFEKANSQFQKAIELHDLRMQVGEALPETRLIFTTGKKLLDDLVLKLQSGPIKMTLLEVEEQVDLIIVGTVAMALAEGIMADPTIQESVKDCQLIRSPSMAYMTLVSELCAAHHVQVGLDARDAMLYKLIPHAGRAALIDKKVTFDPSMFTENSLLGNIISQSPNTDKYKNYPAYQGKQLYMQAYHGYQAAINKTKSDYKWDMRYALLATLITPLTLRYSFPSLLRSPSLGGLFKGILVLIPIVSLFYCVHHAMSERDQKQELQQKYQPIIKVRCVGNEEAVKEELREGKKKIHEANPDVNWAELKKSKRYATEAKSEHKVNVETVSSSQALREKSRKVFNTYKTKNGSEMTDVYMVPGQIDRWRLIQGKKYHINLPIQSTSIVDGITYHSLNEIYTLSNQSAPNENPAHNKIRVAAFVAFYKEHHEKSKQSVQKLEDTYYPSHSKGPG